MESLLHIHRISDELRESLEREPSHPSMAALRRLRYFCSRQFLEAEDKYERFLCFFLSCFIDDVFFNLGGDTPYDKELHNERIYLFKKITETLQSIEKKEKDEEWLLKVLESISDLVDVYSDKINFLNKSKSF